jgi:hypothetical protein
MIMASLFAVAVACYVLALDALGNREVATPVQRA